MKFLALSALVAAVAAAPSPEASAAADVVDLAQIVTKIQTIGSFPVSGGVPSYTVQTLTGPMSELFPTNTAALPRLPAESYVTIFDEPNQTSYVVPVPQITGDSSAINARRFNKPLGALPPQVLDI